jgi:peptide deformylase
MTLLPVITFPALSLKKASVDVAKVDSRIQDLVQNMFETMYVENGIGLAAPQIGENINLFVMDVGKPDPIDPEIRLPRQICMINPKIITAEGEIQYEEGCLSCPELLVMVDRAANIQVSSLDAQGKPQVLMLSELEAVCTQHEMDHLKGILLTDKISQLQRDLYGKKLIRKRKDDADQGDV